MSTRFNLKRRIVLAAVLIPAALLVYRNVERWWAERPRVDPEAYAEARKLAEAEFGRAAVAGGVVTVPAGPIRIPWRATAFVYEPDPYTRRAAPQPSGRSAVCLVLEPRGGRLISGEFFLSRLWGPRALRLTRSQAAQLWAFLTYAERIGVAYDAGLATASYFECAQIRLDGGGSGVAQERRDARLSGINGDMWSREIITAAALETLSASHSDALSRDGAAVEQALEATLNASFPPRTVTDQIILYAFMRDYARLAGRRALPLLRRSQARHERWSAMRAQKKPPWYCRLPFVWQRQERLWQARRNRPSAPVTKGFIWEIEALDGKSDQERRRAALAGFEQPRPGNTGIGTAAAWAIARNWPDEWEGIAAGAYEKMEPGMRQSLLYAGEYPDCGVAYLHKAVADTGNPERAHAARLLWDRTRDPQAVRAAAEVLRGGSEQSSYAATWLASLYASGQEAGDVPGLFREVLARACPSRVTAPAGVQGPAQEMEMAVVLFADTGQEALVAQPASASRQRFSGGAKISPFEVTPVAEGRAAEAVLSALRRGRLAFVGDRTAQQILASPRSGPFIDILEDLAFRPERILPAPILTDTGRRFYGEAAIEALGRAGEHGTQHLLEAADGRPLTDPELLEAVIVALAESRPGDALPAIESLLEKANNARKDAATVQYANEQEGRAVTAAMRHYGRLRATAARLRYKAAADPAEYLASLPASDRPPVSADQLARDCDAETLKRMLADPRMEWARGQIVGALHSLRMQAESANGVSGTR